MNALKRTTVIFIAMALIVGAVLFTPEANSAGAAIKDITLQPGSNETMMNFCWQSTSGGAAVVQLIKGGTAGASFPADAAASTGTVSAATKGYYTSSVTVTGLSAETLYSYRVGNGTVFSAVYSFTTGNSTAYNAIFVSDAQIGASGNAAADAAAWEKTLTAALGKFTDTSFLLSAGDQVDYFIESEYDSFLASPLLRRYPIALAVGNHENLSKSALHAHYYNEPNESSVYGLTPAGGDYWFRYGNTLYLVLNTNNTNVSEHEAFIARAEASSPGAVWTILMFHQSVYSSAAHSAVSSIVTLRKNLVPILDKYNIDVVLSGHDHCYTRTYQMLGGAALKTQSADSQGRIVNPRGTVYITAGSASGSKYYDLKTTPEAYSAVRLQPEVPTFISIEITDGALTMTAYRTDTREAIDTYSIVKQNSSGFTDVPDSAWYAAAVTYLTHRGFTDGTSQRTFSPDMILTRGQCLVLLMKAYGIKPDAAGDENFSDAGSTWYTGYLAAAKRLGLASGTGGGCYQPEAVITRQDMLTLVYHTLMFLHKLPPARTAKTFDDQESIAPYAQEAITALSSCSVISGNGGSINPQGFSTRAQMAEVLYKLLVN